MKYNRYRLTKSAIKDIQHQAEKVTDFIKIENEHNKLPKTI